MPLKIKDYTLPDATSTNLINRFNELFGKQLSQKDYQSFINDMGFCFFAYHKDDVLHNYPLEKYNVAKNEVYYAGFKKNDNDFDAIFRIILKPDTLGKEYFYDFKFLKETTKEYVLKTLMIQVFPLTNYQIDSDLYFKISKEGNHYDEIMNYFDEILQMDINKIKDAQDIVNIGYKQTTIIPFFKRYFD